MLPGLKSETWADLLRIGAMAALLACPSAPARAEGGLEHDPALGWGYVIARCAQETVARSPRNICETNAKQGPGLAIIVSNIARIGDKGGTALAAFRTEVRRLHGLDLEGREVGPFATWREAEAALNESVALTHRARKGKVAFLAIALEPERLTAEPNAEEAERDPPPLPDLMAPFRRELSTLYRTGDSCGLKRPDGTPVLPDRIADPYGQAGEGCPWQVADGYGVYGFDIARSDAICGATGICTELYDDDGHMIGIAGQAPEPLASGRELFERGLLVTGDRIQTLYSIPERRYLFDAPPFVDIGAHDRVVVVGGVIRRDRPAVEIVHRRAGTLDEGYALFFLDTRRFEIVAERRRRPLVKERAPPSLAAYENRDIAACDGDAAWVQDARTDEYLRNAYYAFDKHLRAFAGSFDGALDGAEAATGDDRAHRFARIGLHLDALVPHLARLLPDVVGPADSMALARLAAALDFEAIGAPDAGASHMAYLRTALAREMLKVGRRAGGRDAGEGVDAFLISLGQLRYRLRLAEAGVANPNGDGQDVALLRDEAQRLSRNWREGVRPVAERVILDGSWHTSLGSRLRWHVREMCETEEVGKP